MFSVRDTLVKAGMFTNLDFDQHNCTRLYMIGPWPRRIGYGDAQRAMGHSESRQLMNHNHTVTFSESFHVSCRELNLTRKFFFLNLSFVFYCPKIPLRYCTTNKLKIYTADVGHGCG